MKTKSVRIDTRLYDAAEKRLKDVGWEADYAIQSEGRRIERTKQAMCTRKSIENMFRPRIHSEDGRYWAEIPAMPGCFTVADTLDELKDNLIEAAQCWLLTSADMENYRRNDRRKIERKRTVIPFHGKEPLPQGTLNAICRQAGVPKPPR